MNDCPAADLETTEIRTFYRPGRLDACMHLQRNYLGNGVGRKCPVLYRCPDFHLFCHQKRIVDMTADRSSDWKLLAKRASTETDPEKLMSLIAELNRILDEREKTRHSRLNSSEKGSREGPPKQD
jgi:hypothetical protein